MENTHFAFDFLTQGRKVENRKGRKGLILPISKSCKSWFRQFQLSTLYPTTHLITVTFSSATSVERKPSFTGSL